MERFIIGTLGNAEQRPRVVFALTMDDALNQAIARNGRHTDPNSTTAPMAWAEPYTARRAIRVGVTRL